jgi:anti-sigma B factor antagonist
VSIADNALQVFREGWDPFGPRSFEVQDVVSDGRHRLLLTGELDLAPAAELEATLLRLCADPTKEIVLDLSKLRFMGSIGLRLILLARELCQEHGCEFQLIAGPANIQRVFEMTGLLDALPFRAGDSSSMPS